MNARGIAPQLLWLGILGLCLIANTLLATDGTPVWTNYFNAGNGGTARAIAVDTNENVYVTGYSVGSAGVEYLTMKYSSGGALLWTNRFASPGSDQNVPIALALDPIGNVYVTGTANFTATSGADFLTIKYSTDGTANWTNRFNGTGNGDDTPTGLAVDASSNVYVTGSTLSATSGYDYLTIKYSTAGVALWTNRFNGKRNPSGNADGASAIALDNNGDVYVTGTTGTSFLNANDDDWATIKYSAAGLGLWTNIFSGKGNSWDQANALALDANGNAYVTGLASDTASGLDFATIKYSTAGVPLWTNIFNGPANGDDVAEGLALDPEGNVYISGTFTSTAGDFDWAIIKYSTTGLPLWTNTFKGAGNQRDTPLKLAVDASGNAYAIGFFSDMDTHSDGLTIKYSSTGAVLWTNVINTANFDDVAKAIALDASGNVYVAGYSYVSNTDSDFVTIKYSGPPGPLQFAIGSGSLGYTNGHFSLTLTGPDNSNAVISASSDLQTWNALSTKQLSGGTFRFTDEAATNYSRRYYRARLR